MGSVHRLSKFRYFEIIIIIVLLVVWLVSSFTIYFTLPSDEVLTIDNDCDNNPSLCLPFEKDETVTFDFKTLTAVDKYVKIGMQFRRPTSTEGTFVETIFYEIILMKDGKERNKKETSKTVECSNEICDYFPLLEEPVLLGRGQSLTMKFQTATVVRRDSFVCTTADHLTSYMLMSVIAILLFADMLYCVFYVFYVAAKNLFRVVPFESHLFVIAMILYISPLDLFSYLFEGWGFAIIHGICLVFFFPIMILYIIQNCRRVSDEIPSFLSKKTYYIFTISLSCAFLLFFVVNSIIYVIYKRSNPFIVSQVSVDVINGVLVAIQICLSFIILVWMLLIIGFTGYKAYTKQIIVKYVGDQIMLFGILFLSLLEVSIFPHSVITNNGVTICFFDTIMHVLFFMNILLFPKTS
ncbi:Intimal thickness related receptor IRP domain-containing protein [Entamoeba marina]